jgi:drug/metabolite transporter (DMT)-like permease
MLATTPFALLTMTVIVWVQGNPLPRSPEMIWAVLSGVVGVMALFLLYKGLSVGSMAIVAPISGTGVVIPVILGIFQGDALTLPQILGILAAITGTFFASREKSENESGKGSASGIKYAIGSAFGVGLYFAFMDRASEVDPYWASLFMRISYTMFLLPIVWLTRTSMKNIRPHLPAISFMGGIDGTAGFLFALASTKGMLSVVSVVSALYPGVTVLLSATFLRERIQRSQAFGVVLALLGIALLSSG